MKILIVEDDELIAQTLSAILTNQNYAVEVATDGEAAWDLIETFDYDLILLDVILPKIDGINLCRRIRSRGLQMPILLLTGCDRSHDKAIGLDAGADDYVVKPFDEEELVARVRALLRRGVVSTQPVLEWEELRLDPTSCQVTYSNQLLSLTPKEYALLELFLRNSRRVFSCGMILEHLWSYEDTPGEEAVRTHIKGLRQKLKAAGARSDLIETVYGIGYRLKPLAVTGDSSSKNKEETHSTQTQEKLSPSQPPRVSMPSKPQTLTAIAGVWHRFKGRIEEQVGLLEKAAAAVGAQHCCAPAHQELLASAQREAHTLAGSLGTFGFALGSQLARKIESLLKDSDALTEQQKSDFQTSVELLRQEIQRSPLEEFPPSSAEEQPLLLIVDRDLALGSQLQQAAASPKIQISIVTNIADAQIQLYQQHPSAVLLDPTVAPDWSESLSFLEQLQQRKPPVPVIVFTAATDFSNRLQVARHGGHTFLQKPMPPEQVLSTVQQVLQQSDQGEAQVLLVDDDPKTGVILQGLLRPWGLKVTAVSDPRQFWSTLEAQKPDLLILDVEMPGISGIEICRVVRNEPRWSNLPILFLTVHNDAEIVNQVFAAGADDFVSKPIVGPELAVRIINRLERMKLLRHMSERQRIVALRNQQDRTCTEKNLQTRIQQQATVAYLGQAALRGQDISCLMNEAVALVAKNLEVEYCKLLQLLPDAKTLLLRAGVGWEEGLIGHKKVSLDDSQAGYTLLVKEPVIVEDMRTDTRFRGSDLLHSHGAISGLSVPIAGTNGVYGVLGAHTRKKQAFTQDDIYFLHAIANVLSGAIERHNTEKYLRKSKDELELRVAERTAELIKINEQLQSELNERYLTQEALRISQARFAGIVNIAEDAIISVDKNQRIILFNQGAEKIFGYTASAAIGQPLDLIIPWHFIQAHRHFVTEFGKSPIQSRRMGERREIYGRRKDGTEFPAEASISKLDLGEEKVYTVFLQDITDRKQVEKMKDEFVSVVSHELRTPLTSIHGSLGMLASGMLPPESEAGKRLLQIAVDSTDRLVRLINDILDIERIESGKVKMEKQASIVGDIIQEAVNVMQSLADKDGITLSVDSVAVKEITTLADSDRIVQTLTNLLSNAIKFSPRGNTVWLSAEIQAGDDAVTRRHEDAGNENKGNEDTGNELTASPHHPLPASSSPYPSILFTVKDQGRGIPAGKLDSIFERFQQVDSSDSRNHDGTGLGLAICRSIVQQHGGSIWVDSILGEGSSFYFTLPIIPQTPNADSADAEGKTLPLVLVCDDDPAIHSELQILLQKRGYRVITVDSGEAAIHQAVAQQPDVILLDLMMPAMNGWETMAVLKQREDTKDIPIVICSVYQPTETNQPRTDFVDWVSKPLDETSLFHSLSKAIAGGKVRVLVVENDTDLAEVLIHLLEQHDIETFHAKTGREAIRLSQEVNPDLLVLNLILPEVDGFAVVDWLQQHNRLCSTPLVVYSTKDLDESERQRLKLGHTEFLLKGQVTTQEFEQRVMELLHCMTGNG